MAPCSVFVVAHKGIPFSKSMVHLCTFDCIECWTDRKIQDAVLSQSTVPGKWSRSIMSRRYVEV